MGEAHPPAELLVSRWRPSAIRSDQLNKALESWSSPEAVAKLLEVLSDSDSGRRLAAILALGKMRAAEAAEPLVSMFVAGGEDRVAAPLAIEDSGLPCRAALLSGLSADDEKLALRIIEILRKVGTNQSLPKLVALQRQSSTLASASRTAVQEISRRPPPVRRKVKPAGAPRPTATEAAPAGRPAAYSVSTSPVAAV